MRTWKEIKKHPKNQRSRGENVHTQPLKETAVFNNPDVITESWYPVMPSKKLKKSQATSSAILNQRFALFRGESGEVYALDAFCPHMGADLGNGLVEGDKLKCFFHHWEFDQKGCSSRFMEAQKPCLKSYPVKEKYGFIWIYSGEKESHDVPSPPGLEEESSSWHLKNIKLFAHHHVMMVGGIDLQHFRTVHDLDIKFSYEVLEKDKDVYVWSLEGAVPRRTAVQKIAHYITGGLFKYQALFAGGTVTSLTYGSDLTWRGRGKRKLPNVHILWGAVPQLEGVSAVDIFVIVPKFKGFLAPLKRGLSYLMTLVVLKVLSDDDVKAFPNMRFNLGLLAKEDESVARLAKLLDELKVSKWSKSESV